MLESLQFAMCAARLLGRSKSYIPEATPLEKFDISRNFHHSYRIVKEPDWQKEQLSHRLRRVNQDVKMKDGFLWMQSSPHINKTWKLRYLMLLEEKLCYLKENRDKLSLDASFESDWKVINISEINSLKVSSDGVTPQISDSETDIFCVKTQHCKYLFKCRHQNERNDWVTAILTAKSSSLMKER